jgi:hypothetical protein
MLELVPALFVVPDEVFDTVPVRAAVVLLKPPVNPPSRPPNPVRSDIKICFRNPRHHQVRELAAAFGEAAQNTFLLNPHALQQRPHPPVVR